MPAVLEVVSTKITEGSLSKEESISLSEESAKMREYEDLKEKINESIAPNTIPQYSAGTFFNNSLPVGNEVLLPSGYVMTQLGVFIQTQGEDSEEYCRITKVPFFVACRTRTHIMISYFQKDEWLREWLRPSEVKPSLLSNLFIFPEKNIKAKELIEYATASAAISPLVRSDDFTETLVQEFYRIHVPVVAEFPFLVRASLLVQMCGEMEIKYEEVRKWMERGGYIDYGPGKVKRAPDPDVPGLSKAQRFLVLLKPFKVKLEDTEE